MENVGICYDNLEYFTAIGYNLLSVGIPIWYVWTKKNLATLHKRQTGEFNQWLFSKRES
jgi:hypothetical protein